MCMHVCVRIQCMACFVAIEGEACVHACVRACSMCAYYGMFCRH